MSSESEVSGRGAATTRSPCLLRGRMTSFQLDPSAQAPCGTTTVLFSRNSMWFPSEELLDAFRNKIARILKREVTRVDKVQLRVRNVALVGLRPFYCEKRIVSSPNNEHARLFGPEVLVPTVV